MVNNANICRKPVPEFIPKTRRKRSLPLKKSLFPPLSPPPLPLKFGLKNLLKFKNSNRSQVQRFKVRTYSGGVFSRVTILAEWLCYFNDLAVGETAAPACFLWENAEGAGMPPLLSH